MLPLKTNIGISLIKISPKLAAKATKAAAEMMKENIEAEKFNLILFSSCGGRGQVLGLKYSQEIQSIKKVVGKDVPCFGLCACGEQAFYGESAITGTQFTVAMMGISDRLIYEKSE